MKKGKTLLMSALACMMSFGVCAQNTFNEWFADGRLSSPLKLVDEVNGETLSGSVAELLVPDDAASDDGWAIQFCAVFYDNAGQVEDNKFSLTFDVYWEPTTNADTAHLFFLTGKMWYDEYGGWLHEDYQWSGDNTELLDVPGATSIPVYAPINVYKNNWQTVTIEGTIGDRGAEFIGVQINMCGDEDNAGTYYFRNINVRMGDKTNLNYYEVMPADIDAVNVGNISYMVISPSEVKALSFTDTAATSAVIPASVEIEGRTYSVTDLGGNLFKGISKLESITIPNSVVNINTSFGDLKNLTSVKIETDANVSKSNLYFTKDSVRYHVIGKESVEVAANMRTNVVIPESVVAGNTFAVVSIGEKAFYECENLKSLTIPNSIVTIGKNAFAYCNNLESVTIGNSVTNIGESAFADCQNLKSLNISNSVKYIGSGAFSDCDKLESVSIPNSVKEIGTYAFEYCIGLKSVTIGDSVSYIGSSAFYGCWNLAKAEFSSIESLCGMNFSNQNSNPLNMAKHLYIGGKEVTELVIPDGVSTIEDYAFVGCGSLTSVSIPNTVTQIGESVFDYCNGLKAITIPGSVEYVGYDAFSYCDSLTSVTIEGDVSISGAGLHFTKDSIVYGVLTRNNVELKYYGKSGEIEIPSSVTAGGTFEVTVIGSQAFSGCKGLESITIPATITRIGDYAFYNCENLTSVIIPNTVTNIGYDAFAYCKKLKSVVLPDMLTTISSSLFQGCCSLGSIVIPNTVSEISSSAFNGCTNLKSVIIGSNVNSISRNAFADCDSLTTITIKRPTPPYDNSWYGSIFGSLDSVGYSKITLRVPQGSKNDYQHSAPWSNISNIVEYPIYKVTLLVDGGDARVSGDGLYEVTADAKAIVSTEPNTGYQFVKWSDGNTDNPRTINLKSDTTLTAIFIEKYVTVTMLVDNVKHGYIEGATKVREGSRESFYAIGVGEYVFDHWNIGGTKKDIGFRVTHDTTLIAYFKKAPLCNVVLLSSDYTMGEVADNGSCRAGTSVDISASAYEGYRFVRWSDGNTNWWRYITVESDTNLVAYFEPLPKYEVKFAVADSCKQRGNVVYAGSQTVSEGDYVEVLAIANKGYRFTGWYNADGSLFRDYPEIGFYVKRDTALFACFVTAEITDYVCVPYSGTTDVPLNIGDTITIYDSEGKSNYRNGNRGYLQINAPKGYAIKISGVYDTEGCCDYLRIYQGADRKKLVDWKGYGIEEQYVGDSVATLYFYSDGSSTDSGIELTATAVKLIDIDDVPFKVALNANDTALGEVVVNNIVEVGSSYLFNVSVENKRPGRFNCWSDNYIGEKREVKVTSDTTLTAIFNKRQAYTVTIQSSDTTLGKVQGSPSGIYYYGESLEIGAVSQSKEFSFVRWSDGSKDSYRYYSPTGDITLVAEFKRNKACKVNFQTNDASLGYISVSDTGTYYEGQTLYIWPEYESEDVFFIEWENGSTNGNKRTVTLSGDTTFTAKFEAMPYKVDFQSNDTTMGYAEYLIGERINQYIYSAIIYPDPKPGYVFKKWSDGCITQWRTDFYITSDTVVVAYFEPIKYDINLVTDNGEISMKGSQLIDNIVVADFNVYADDGYCFANWSDGITMRSRTFAVKSDTVISAHFVKFPYNVTVDCDSDKGSVSYSTSSSSLDDTRIELNAIEKNGYVFSRWSTENSSRRPTVNVNSDTTFTAYFEELAVKVMLYVNDDAMGAVRSYVTSHGDNRTEIDFWAIPNPNYHFVAWSDNEKHISRYQTFQKDTAITAIFAPDMFKISVAANDASMGKVSAVDSAAYKTNIKLNATANSGYKFVKWSDGNTDNPRTITVTGEMKFTAIFEKNETTPGTAIVESAADAVSIYAHHNTIVVENANSEIRVFDAMGRLVATANKADAEIRINSTGIFVVKVGDVVKRVMLND